MDTMTVTQARELDLADTTLRVVNDLLQGRPAQGLKPLEEAEPAVVRNPRAPTRSPSGWITHAR